MIRAGFARTSGELLGSYTLEEPIGRGGFSEVWRAHAPGGGLVAIKVLVNPEHAAQLRAEAKALSLVQGPGIVPVLAVELEHEPPFLVLQLLRGGDLRARLALGGFSAADAVALFEKILAVLERVHREGIVHGDLKPENVLFDDRIGHEAPRVADFGLSRRISQHAASLSLSASLEDARIAGTLDYMAPEQRRGEKPTPRSDVFALGVVFHELLTGERPQGIFRMPSERDPTLPPVIDRALTAALAPDPEQRFASAGALLAFVRSGLGSDWQALAVARERVVKLAQANDPARLFWTSLVASSGLATLMAVVSAVGDRDYWRSPGATVGLGLFGAILGLGAALSLRTQLAPSVARRRAEIDALRERIERQIRAETTWAVVREARRAAALAAPSSSGAIVAAALGVAILLWMGWGIGGTTGLVTAATISLGVGGALFAALRWNRDTRYRRAVPLRLKPDERRDRR